MPTLMSYDYSCFGAIPSPSSARTRLGALRTGMAAQVPIHNTQHILAAEVPSRLNFFQTADIFEFQTVR
jgi:hypothetical protein